MKTLILFIFLSKNYDPERGYFAEYKNQVYEGYTKKELFVEFKTYKDERKN